MLSYRSLSIGLLELAHAFLACQRCDSFRNRRAIWKAPDVRHKSTAFETVAQFSVFKRKNSTFWPFERTYRYPQPANDAKKAMARHSKQEPAQYQLLVHLT